MHLHAHMLVPVAEKSVAEVGRTIQQNRNPSPIFFTWRCGVAQCIQTEPVTITVCVYICVYIYIYEYVCIYICVYIYMHYLYVYIYIIIYLGSTALDKNIELIRSLNVIHVWKPWKSFRKKVVAHCHRQKNKIHPRSLT